MVESWLLMELGTFLLLRKTFNVVRNKIPISERLTFEEFAILCHLQVENRALKTSQIAAYQNVLRTTMTHRIKLLAQRDYITRTSDRYDRRSVLCDVTDKGKALVSYLTEAMLADIKPVQPLYRTRPERIVMFVDAMGSIFCTAKELVLLGLFTCEQGSSISVLVENLGLLQPTISMSVKGLVDDGLATRNSGDSRTTWVSLSDKGRSVAEDLAKQIGKLVVRRTRGA